MALGVRFQARNGPRLASTARLSILVMVIAMGVGEAEARRMRGLHSPRLKALAASITEGDEGTVSRFWTKVEAEGTPLIEPIEGQSDYVWLTFVYRGDAETTSVVLIGGISGDSPYERSLERIEGTNVWYATYRMRNDLRARYGFSVNDPMTPINYDDPEEVQRRLALFGPDPLAKTKPFQNLTYLELENAPPQTWVERNPRAAKGKLENEKEFRSETLDNARRISVYLPPNYRKTGEPYPMLLVFDLFPYLTQVPTPRILDNLIAAEKIPPAVAVFVGNVPGKRGEELGCNDDFNAFLATELLPWVREKYHVSEDPKRNIVAGSSFGGIASTFFALHHSDLVGNVLSQSGSYMFAPDQGDRHESDPEFEAGWLIREYMKAKREPLRFYLEVGLREPGVPSMPVINRYFRDVLKAKGYEIVAYSEFNGGHDYVNWRGSLADGLIALWGE